MLLYLAGYGHPFERTPIMQRMDEINILLSYYYLGVQKDQGMINRFTWVRDVLMDETCPVCEGLGCAACKEESDEDQ